MSFHPLIAVNLQGYGRASGQVQQAAQEGLAKTLELAAERAGIDPEHWEWQAGGGEVLAMLPPGTSMPLLVDRFARELNGALNDRNRLYRPEALLRLRVAVHHGPAERAALGFTGEGPVTVTGLCNGQPLRAALDVTGGRLGLIVSETVFRGTIAAGKTSLEPADLRQVRLPELGREANAWLWLPGFPSIAGLDFADGMAAEPAEPPPEPPRQESRQESRRESKQESRQEQPWAPSDGGTVTFPGATFSNTGTVVGRDQHNQIEHYHEHGGRG
jgi:hypothetical protein